MLAKTAIPIRRNVNDFSRLLVGQNFREYGEHYYLLGNIKGAGGWWLNVSIIESQIVQAFATLVPKFLKEKIAFKIVRNIKSASLLLTSSLGYKSTGKLLSVFPQNEQHAVYLAKELIRLTQNFRGPAIPTDTYLGGCLYTAYGAYDASDDQFSLPFNHTKGISWPFTEIISRPQSKSNILKGTYFIQETLKSDAKGRVLKALRFKGLSVKRCVIKEGLHDMFIDEAGRDFQARVEWQYKASCDLYGKIPVPKPYELFTENGNTYFAMETIPGKSLDVLIADIHQNQSWRHLDWSKKNILLEYLSRLINIIQKLHASGYIHRDISLGNFIVDQNDRLHPIDLELSYNYKDNCPQPAFQAGINGSTAPERIDAKVPSTAEDVYSLGAVIATFLTNIFPAKGYASNVEHLRLNLDYLIGDSDFVNIIIHCLQEDPADRPTIEHVSNAVDKYRKSHSANAPSPQRRENSTSRDLTHIITDGLRALATPLLTDNGGLWHSNYLIDDNLVENDQKKMTLYPGLFSGVSGVIYALADAKAAGFPIHKLAPNWTTNFKYLLHYAQKQKTFKDPGLSQGSAGIALALLRAAYTGLVSPNAELKRTITHCLLQETNNPSLSDGLAGQGLALIASLDLIESDEIKRKLNDIVSTLLATQDKKGAWPIENQTYTGLSKGTAGIILFLIAYYKKFVDAGVTSGLEKALDSLLSMIKVVKGKFICPVSDKQRTIDPWLMHGLTGIGIVFTKASAAFQHPQYANTARQLILSHPPHLTTNNLTVDNGLVGIGHAYLEYASVFDDQDINHRNEHIVNQILNTSYVQQNDSKYWATENRRPSSADLMFGNAGIIQYLLRAKSPNSLQFIV